jgi:parallel beta-helix repeat protein
VSPDGDDAASGLAAAAQGADGPFRSLQRLESIGLRDGDQVRLRCGQHFSGPLSLRLVGAGKVPVVVAPYGDCADGQKPLIDGRQPVSMVAGAAGLATLQAEVAVTQVFFDGTAVAPARFPRDGYAFFPAGTVAGPDRVPLDALPPLPGLQALQGARAIVRTQEWLIEERELRDASGRVAPPLEYPARPKTGAYFTGKAWMLGSGDGWAYDADSKLLSVRNPSGRAVSVAYEAPLLRAEGKGALTIGDLAFEGAGGNAIDIHVAGAVRLERVEVRHSAGNAIAIAGTPSATVVDSVIDGAARDGIFFAEVGRAEVSHTDVFGAGTWMGPRPALAAINAHRTDAALIEDNHVRDSGYIGIRVSGDAKVRRNLLENTCRMISDCAAIYTWRRNVRDIRPPLEISGNLIVGVVGDISVKLGVIDYFSGIYLDEFTRKTTVRNNVIAGAAQGIYLHNSVDNTVSGNLIVGARQRTLLLGIDAKLFAAEPGLGNDVQRNAVPTGNPRWQLQRNANAAAGQPAWTLDLLPAAATAAPRAPADCVPVPFADDVADSGSKAMATVLDCRR